MFGGLFAPFDQCDARGGGGGALGQDLLSEQGVDQGALAGVELAGDDDQKKFIQLQDGLLQAVEGFARQIEPGQGQLEPGQGFFFVAQEMGLPIGEHGLMHGLLLINAYTMPLSIIRPTLPPVSARQTVPSDNHP